MSIAWVTSPLHPRNVFVSVSVSASYIVSVSVSHRIGSFIPAVGVCGPFVWKSAAPALAVPTSVIGGAMLPIAYVSFLLLMNSRAVLGEAMPTGTRRIIWNTLMILGTGIASFASAWGLYGRMWGSFPIGTAALAALVIMLVLGIYSFLVKQR